MKDVRIAPRITADAIAAATVSTVDIMDMTDVFAPVRRTEVCAHTTAVQEANPILLPLDDEV